MACRRRLLLVFAVALVAVWLVGRSHLRLVGDGPEYFVLAERLATLDGPVPTIADVRRQGLEYPELRTSNGRQVLPHFWFYSAAAAPVVAAMRGTGHDTRGAFVVVNLALYVAMLWLIASRWHPAVAVYLGVSPILWWVDKAHTEVFAFSLLATLVTTWRTHPGPALLVAGILAGQHPQALPFFVVVAIATWWRARMPGAHPRPGRGWIAGAVGLAGSYGAFYQWHIGRWTPLAEGGDVRIPAITTMGAVLWDLNIGLVANAPIIALVVLYAAALRLRHRDRDWAHDWGWAAASLVLLAAFAQTMNVNHGGTPGMSRYALWLIPLTVPLIGSALRQAAPVHRRSLIGAIVASAFWNVLAFAPARGEGFLEPTRLALYQWRHFPGAIDPLPEIFAERLRHQESVNTFAAVDDCAKALLQSGQWPAPCAPAPVPATCQPDGVHCYANRTIAGYDFRVVTRRGGVRLWPRTP